MQSWIYKSMKKARTCLYVDRQDDFTRVSPLLELPGDLRLVISGWRSQVGDLGGVGIPAFAGMASVRATSDQNMKDQFESGIIDFCFACRTQVRGVSRSGSFACRTQVRGVSRSGSFACRTQVRGVSRSGSFPGRVMLYCCRREISSRKRYAD